MTDLFEYDVFISFSSADEEIVKPIWQELCSNGLRVFWSDSSLKKEAGNSWFEVIEKSLERSRHMLLICSDNSMNSKWVQREYRAFFDYCYSPNSRRLIPLLTNNFQPSNLPLFLRQLQVGKTNDSEFIQEIITILGGVNIEKLQQELQSLKEQVNLLSVKNESLSKIPKAESKKVNALARENTAAKKQIDKLSNENTALREQISKLANDNNFLHQTSQERETLLTSENTSLKVQIAELAKNNNILNEQLQKQEKSLSNENTSLREQIEKLINEKDFEQAKLTDGKELPTPKSITTEPREITGEKKSNPIEFKGVEIAKWRDLFDKMGWLEEIGRNTRDALSTSKDNYGVSKENLLFIVYADTKGSHFTNLFFNQVNLFTPFASIIATQKKLIFVQPNKRIVKTIEYRDIQRIHSETESRTTDYTISSSLGDSVIVTMAFENTDDALIVNQFFQWITHVSSATT